MTVEQPVEPLRREVGQRTQALEIIGEQHVEPPSGIGSGVAR
jgi:hypothetical protein